MIRTRLTDTSHPAASIATSGNFLLRSIQMTVYLRRMSGVQRPDPTVDHPRVEDALDMTGQSASLSQIPLAADTANRRGSL